jgi:hypothetical protein
MSVPSSAAGWSPQARIARHRHRCPDGTLAVCVSQLVVSRGLVLDRWWVAGALIATSTRTAVGAVRARDAAELRVVDPRLTASVPAAA